MRCRLIKRVLPLATPLATGSGTINERTVWALAIHDDAGHIGLGEAAPLPEFGSESATVCREAFTKSLTALKADFLTSWLERGRPDAPLGALEKLLVGAPCTRAAIEGALIDLLAQQQERPLAELLAASSGNSAASRLAVNALLGGGISEVAEAASRLGRGGFSCFKLKVGGPGNLGQDIERVYAVRTAIGAATQLRVDANGSWSLDQALEFAVEAGDANLEFCEQPLGAGDLEGLGTLRRRTGMKIAVDESVRSAADIGRVAAAQAADVVVLKPMFLGGWRPTLQAAQLARSCGLDVVVTTTLDGAIGRAHATHYTAALALGERAHGLATGILLAEDISASPLAVENGYIAIPAIPGLGIGALRG
jgi:o-succinylbenzoate synthase